MIRFLETVCPAHLQDEVEGDFLEHYDGTVRRKTKGHADRKAFVFLLLSTPRLLLKRKYHVPNHIDMLKNYIIIALRNLKRQMGYALINIFGLAIGLTCCMLIGIYVIHELSYDEFHTQADNIFRANVTYSTTGGSRKSYTTPTALLPNLRREFNEVTTGTRVFNISMFSPVVVQKDDAKYQEERFFYADSTFFDVFSFEIVSGNPEKALAKPMSVMLTESSVSKYFNDEDPLGKVVKVDGTDYTITGILADIPDNSHIKFDFLASFSSRKASRQEIWSSANYATYVVLSNADTRYKLEEGMNELVMKQLGDLMGETQISFDLMALRDIHLRSDTDWEMQPQGDIRYIYIISIVGLLILVIACINYMNLATARSIERAREVGMRKVLGAVRKQVFHQFMGESVIITTISMIIALILVNMSIGAFNQLTGKALSLGDVFSSQLIAGLIVTFVLVSFLAGAYPALSLSSFAPGDVLKGSFKRSKSGIWMRKALVIVQFSISIFLIIGTLVIYQQLNYMRNKKLGYNKENVLVLPTDNVVNKNFATIKTELEQRDDVVAVSIASESPTDIGGGYSLSVPGYFDDLGVRAITVGTDFLGTMQMELVSGRNFNDSDYAMATREKRQERQYSFIVNRELIKTLMVDEGSILGQKINLNGRQGEIIGVVDDFHFTSLHTKISSLVLFIEPWQFHKIFIRVKSQDLQKTILAVEDRWKEIVPDRPFVFDFLDDEYDAMYRGEMRLSNVFTTFAVLAIVIACLGLFGLVSFAVQQRTKEIGVRKVMGASVASLFFLVSKDFSRLVLIAFLIAGPLGYWLMDQWLNDFEYRITIGFLPIVFSIFCALLVAFLTVSYQSMKAATVNPAEILRNE